MHTNNSRTALHLAVAGNHSHIVEYLLTEDAKLQVQDPDGRTPLIIVRSEDEHVTK